MADPPSTRLGAVGLPPGTLIHVGKERTHRVKVSVIDYSEPQFEEKEVGEVDECLPFRDTPTVTWINVDGIHELDIIERLGRSFNLHPLLMEDVANTNQRPKTEDGEGYVFTVVKMLYRDEHGEIGAEQVSLVIGPNFVISFQEREGDVFEGIRDRIRTAKGRIRKMGADYLAYSLIDAIVDNYFAILEGLGEEIESLEEELASDPPPDTPNEIRRLKREVLFLRKSVWPLREVLNALARGDSPLIHEQTLPYLRDVYDHTIQVVDSIESARDAISGMRETYLSVLSHRMNEVMKVLTIIATIFIPLTFIAGIYGMNFHEMPELKWAWGYPAVWGVMVIVAALMVVYFRKKRWL